MWTVKQLEREDALGQGRVGGPDDSFGSATSLAIMGVADWNPKETKTCQGLISYFEEVMGPLELPAIHKAAELARAGKVDELVELDNQLAGMWPAGMMREASRGAGLRELRRLRALRDFRVLPKFKRAVEARQANGWHVVVYGIVLALYSIPTRQGLAHYIEKTVEAMARSSGLAPTQAAEIEAEIMARSPAWIEAAVGAARLD